MHDAFAYEYMLFRLIFDWLLIFLFQDIADKRALAADFRYFRQVILLMLTAMPGYSRIIALPFDFAEGFISAWFDARADIIQFVLIKIFDDFCW